MKKFAAEAFNMKAFSGSRGRTHSSSVKTMVQIALLMRLNAALTQDVILRHVSTFKNTVRNFTNQQHTKPQLLLHVMRRLGATRHYRGTFFTNTGSEYSKIGRVLQKLPAIKHYNLKLENSFQVKCLAKIYDTVDSDLIKCDSWVIRKYSK